MRDVTNRASRTSNLPGTAVPRSALELLAALPQLGRTPGAHPPTLQRIEAHVANEVLEPRGGTEKAVRLLAEEHGIETSLHGSATIEFSEPLPRHAEPQLYLALGLTRKEGPIVARGMIEDGMSVLAIWKAPYLVVERCNRRHWGRMFQLPEALSPLHYANPDAERPREVASWTGEEFRPEQAEDRLRLAAPQRQAEGLGHEPPSRGLNPPEITRN